MWLPHFLGRICSKQNSPRYTRVKRSPASCGIAHAAEVTMCNLLRPFIHCKGDTKVSFSDKMPEDFPPQFDLLIAQLLQVDFCLCLAVLSNVTPEFAIQNPLWAGPYRLPMSAFHSRSPFLSCRWITTAHVPVFSTCTSPFRFFILVSLSRNIVCQRPWSVLRPGFFCHKELPITQNKCLLHAISVSTINQLLFLQPFKMGFRLINFQRVRCGSQ